MRVLRPLLAAATASAAILALTVPASAAEQPNTRTAELAWGACPEGTASGPAAGQLQCTTVQVPLDYREPAGDTIDIAVSRLASTDQDERRGVLLTNPGGPGGPGLGLPADLVALGAPASLLDRYDVIGFDPRGIGRSAPVSCGFTADQGYLSNVPLYAVRPGDVAERAKVAKGVAQQCADSPTAPKMPFMTTANTARDMDLIRDALGERTISYFGLSYGTALGTTYASMFPDRTDRFVLDSNVPGTSFDHAAMRRLGLGAEQRFPDFAKYAAARSDTYEIGRTPAEVRRNYFALIERLDDHPVAGVDGKTFPLLVFSSLYSDSLFPSLGQLWQSLARSDDGAVQEQLSATQAEPSPTDQLLSAQLAVMCGDSTWPSTVGAYQAGVRADRVRRPVFGPGASNIGPCAYWPTEPIEPPVQVSPNGPSNILLLQNLRDPATPYVGGRTLRAKFGDRARLVTVDQGGHGVYLFDDNPCGLNITTRYLVHGDRPATDRFCPASTASGLSLTEDQRRTRQTALRDRPLL